jgi:catabolite regulation protein CreA
MKTILVLATVITLASCGGTGSVVSKQLSGSDSLVINFNIPQTNNIAKAVTTTQSKAIKKLSSYVDGKSTEAYKCGYDGNLLFYKKGTLIGDAAFNYSGDGCHHFIMQIKDELVPTSMSNEAADFLKSLAEGKDWY